MKKLLSLLLMLFCVATLSAQNIAVLNFGAGTGVSQYDVDGISEIFNTHFSPKGYTLVERTLINKVSEEQNFQGSQFTQEQMVRLGEILNASVIVYGSISIIADQYQVDVRAVDVGTGEISAKDGFTWDKSTDFRSAIGNLAKTLADKIAIAKEPETIRKRTEVEVVLGYLKVYPQDLGLFPYEPTTVIAQVNKQHLYDYDTWRLPLTEELALLRTNNYIGKGKYMSKEDSNSSGILLLVTDAEESYSERIAREAKEAEERRIAEEQARIAAEKAAAEKAEAERLAAEKAEAERLAAEKAEAERLAAEKAEAERLAAEKAEAERLAAEKAEAERLAAQKKAVLPTKVRRHSIASIKKGYQQEVSVAYSWMTNYTSENQLSVNYIGGYRFNHHLYLGIGTGLNFSLSNVGYYPYVKLYSPEIYYSDYKNNIYSSYTLPVQVLAVPLYGHIKVYLSKNKWAPFLAFSGGVLLSSPKEVSVYRDYNLNDFMETREYGAVSGIFEVMPGVSYQFNKKLALNLQFGYATRQIHSWISSEINSDFWYHGFTARFGLVF